MTIEITALEFDTEAEALQHVDASGRGKAIHVGEQYLVVEQPEADRLTEAGVAFTYLFERYMPDGTWRTITVPVNQD